MTINSIWISICILFVSTLITICYSTIDEDVYVCSDGKLWQCIVEQVNESPTLTSSPDIFKDTPRLPSRRKKSATIYFSYLNKVSEDGTVYVSARLKIALQQMALQNATGLSIQIVPKEARMPPIYYQAQLIQRIPIPDGYTIDFTIPVENQLKYEKGYTLKFDLLPLHLGVSTQKSLFVQSYELPDDVDCADKLDQDEPRMYTTSRFSSSFKQLTFYPFHSTVNLSFYAAPRSYCLSYEVQLALGGSFEVESHFVHASEMQELNGKTLVGTVTLTKILADKNYTIRIVPYSPTNSCVCYDCTCVLVQSELFSLPQVKTVRKEPQMPSKEITTTKHSNSPNEQLLRIQIVDDRVSSNENGLMFMLIVFFCVLSLTFISAALIILLCRSSVKPNALILVKSARISQQQTPLLDYKPTSQTILMLNAEPSKAKLIEILAKMLENADSSVNVLYMEREQKEIETNLQMWCHNALLKANKIILFHSNRAAYLMSNKSINVAKQVSILDSTFQMLLSLTRINDTRFIHACWDDQRVSLFHNVETIYSLPCNIQYVFSGLNLSLPTLEQCALFQEEYQKAIEPIEEETKEKVILPTQNLQTVIVEDKFVCRSDEDDETFESGYKTIDSLEEQHEVDEDNCKDLISIGRSSADSGLII